MLLQHLVPSESTEVDEDLIPMLTAMGLSLDRFCPYHEYTCHSSLSPKVWFLCRQSCRLLREPELCVQSSCVL